MGLHASNSLCSWKNYVQQQEDASISIPPFIHPPIREPQSVRPFENLHLNGAWVCFPAFRDRLSCRNCGLYFFRPTTVPRLQVLIHRSCWHELSRMTLCFKDAKKKAVFSAGDELARQSVGTCRCHSTVRLCTSVLVYLCTYVLVYLCTWEYLPRCHLTGRLCAQGCPAWHTTGQKEMSSSLLWRRSLARSNLR